MTQAATQGSTTTFTYDHSVNRVSQTSGSTTTIYPSKFYSITSTTVGANTYATSTVYVWNGDTLIATIDQPLINGSATGTAATRYIHPDHLGSTNIVTDESGNLVQDVEYYPYGETRLNQQTYPTKEQRQYIGQYKDGNSLSYLNARYLNSQQGQFLSEDPVFLGNPAQQVLTNPQQLNAYAYSHDNPVNSKDPQGLLGPETLAEAAFATPAGFIVGFAGQAARDYSAGQLSPYENYFGSMVGGAVALNIALDSDGLGIPVANGVGGSAGEITTQVLKNLDKSQRGYDAGNIITEGVTSAGFSFVFDLGLAPIANRIAGPMVTSATTYTFNNLGTALRSASASILSQTAKGTPASVAQGMYQGGGLAGIKQSLLNIQSLLNSLSPPAASPGKSTH